MNVIDRRNAGGVMCFSRLANGAKTIARDVQEAFDSWNESDMDYAILMLERVRETCSTMASQANEAANGFRALAKGGVA